MCTFVKLSPHPEKFLMDLRTKKSKALPFTMAKIRNYLRWTSVNEWLKKTWYLNTMGYSSVIKRMKFCHLQQYE